MAKSPTIKGTFGPFTFAYPHLTAPDTEGKFADNKYKVDGIGDPASAPMKALKAALTAACKELGVPKGANLPLKAEMGPKDDKGVKKPTGQHMFRTKSKFAPAIVDASGKPIKASVLAKLKIGAGSTGILQGYFQAYVLQVREKVDGVVQTVEEPGVSFTLTGVQLISVVAGQGGGADFGAYEGGGYSADDSDVDDDADDIQPDTGPDAGDDGDLDI